jgi:hypothetical protein
LGTSHNVRRAWEYLLTDSAIQYNFLAYDEVIRNGVPSEYQVLILPAEVRSFLRQEKVPILADLDYAGKSAEAAKCRLLSESWVAKGKGGTANAVL